MNKVLFVSPTVYSNPITKDIQKKFQSLSKEISNNSKSKIDEIIKKNAKKTK